MSNAAVTTGKTITGRGPSGARFSVPLPGLKP
jgi:hypothetical protein